MTSYSVVHFFEDESVEAVPSFWIKKSNGTCAWPRNKLSVVKSIERKRVPNDIEFNYFKARILKNNIASLIEATAYAEKATTQSDLSADDNNKAKRKLLAKKMTHSYSECPEYPESEEEHSNDITTISLKRSAGWSPSPRKILKNNINLSTAISSTSIKRPSIVKQLSYDKSSIIIDEEKESYNINFHGDTGTDNKISHFAGYSNHEDINLIRSSDIKLTQNKNAKIVVTPLSKSVGTPKDDLSTPIKFGKEFQKDVLHGLSFIKHELRRIVSNQREITQRLDVMESTLETLSKLDISANCSKSSASITDVASGLLPLENFQDLEELERKISEDHSFRISLVNQLSYMGGTHVKSMVKRLMGKLFKDELLKDFSYTGKKGKKKFSTLAICSVVFDAVKSQVKYKHIPQNEVEDVIKYILAQAPFNLKRQIGKNN